MLYDKLSNAVDNLSVSLRSTAPLPRGASGEEIKFSEMPKPPLVRSNGDDRRQWRKQGVAVGAAASKTQAERCGCWVPQPGLVERSETERLDYMNYLLKLAYDGTNYCGFQVQPNGRSVAAAFQDALEAVLGCRPDIKGCSRTDAGVHALGFMLNFHADTRIPAAKLPLALNQHLPPDIRALEAQVVPDDFHARYAAHTKTYLYRIHNSQIDSPFAARYYTKVPGRLDADRMQQAAQYFVGKHDFLALCASGSSAAAHGDTVRTITACDVQRRGDDIDITVTADGYLYNMVRILAGTLCEAGAGRLAPEAVPGILASRDRKNAGPTLAAKGLFLKSVDYDTPIE